MMNLEDVNTKDRRADFRSPGSAIVLGGGVSGLGVARALVERGWQQVIVIEKGRLGGATSNNSHHIIHGGFRYLKSFDIFRTLESIRSLHELAHRYPQCVKPLPCLMALGSSLSEHPLIAKLGAQFYNLLAGSRVNSAEVVRGRDIELSAPFAEILDAKALLNWWDGLLVDHQRLVKLVADDLRLAGAEIVEEEQVVEIAKLSEGFKVTSRRGGKLLERLGSVVVSTVGPWDGAIQNTNFAAPGEAVPDWCRAFNVVLKNLLEPRFAVGIKSLRSVEENSVEGNLARSTETSGRLFFFVPRSERRTAIGTGYLPLVDGRREAKISEDEVSSFLAEASGLIEGAKFSLRDVDRVEAGVLPIRGWRAGEAQLFGREQIWVKRFSQDPTACYVRVLSTKYTTFLEQGRRVARRV